MADSRAMKSTLSRGLIAFVLLAVCATFVGKSIVPSEPVWIVLAYTVGGAFAAGVLLVAAMVASLQFRQFVIRNGGTAPQWFWFSSEPAGLVRLREEEREKSARGHQHGNV